MHQRHVQRRVAVRLEGALQRLHDPLLPVAKGAAAQRSQEDGDAVTAIAGLDCADRERGLVGGAEYQTGEWLPVGRPGI